jgi:hypothetical protein
MPAVFGFPQALLLLRGFLSLPIDTDYKSMLEAVGTVEMWKTEALHHETT